MYHADHMASYGYNSILTRPSTLKEYFYGKCRCIMSVRPHSYRRIDRILARGEDWFETRVINGMPVTYLWFYAPKPADKAWHNEYRNDICETADYMLVDNRIHIHVAGLAIENDFGLIQGLIPARMSKRKTDVPNGKLYYKTFRAFNGCLDNQLRHFNLFEEGDPAIDPSWIPFDAPNVISIADAHCELPKYRLDRDNGVIVKKTRDEFIASCAKWWIEREVTNYFGNPGALISTLDETIMGVLKVMATQGMLDTATGDKVNTLPNAGDFGKHMDNFMRIQEIKKQVYAEIDAIVPHSF